MPRIPDEWLDCSIYLYGSEADAHAGKKTGGSGFLVGVDSERLEGLQVVYAVTNAHVIEGGSYTIRLNKKDGTCDVRDFDERHWIIPESKDDIAVCAMSMLDQVIHNYKCVPFYMLATKDVIAEFAIGPGDDVFAIGRFINVDGKQRNLPSLRFGNIAQMPGETIRQERILAGQDYFDQESYLVEAKSISGFSGSPVFVRLTPFEVRPEKNVNSNTTRLLGVQWGHVLDWEDVCDGSGRPLDTKFKVQTNTGMMAVVPAWVLHDLLMRPDMVAKRTVSEEAYLNRRGLPTSALSNLSADAQSEPLTTDENPQGLAGC